MLSGVRWLAAGSYICVSYSGVSGDTLIMHDLVSLAGEVTDAAPGSHAPRKLCLSVPSLSSTC